MPCHFNHVRLFVTPWTVARQAPLSMRFSRQGYWRGLPSPPPGGLPDSAVEPTTHVSYISSIGRLGSPFPLHVKVYKIMVCTWSDSPLVTLPNAVRWEQTRIYSSFAHSRTLICGYWMAWMMMITQQSCFKLSLEAQRKALILETAPLAPTSWRHSPWVIPSPWVWQDPLSPNKQDMEESMKHPFWGQRWWLPFYYSPLPSLTLREMPPCWDAAWEIQPVHPRGNQPWMFTGKAAAAAEAPMLWLPDAKNWLTRKDPSAAKDWRQDEKETTTEDEMVGWHHQLNECEFEQTQGDSERHRSLVCCSSWSCQQSDTTYRLNTTTMWRAHPCEDGHRSSCGTLRWLALAITLIHRDPEPELLLHPCATETVGVKTCL